MPTNETQCTGSCNCTPNPLNSGNWHSESTLGRSNSPSNAEPPYASLSPSPSPNPECKISFIIPIITKEWKEATFDATTNLDTNCEKQDVVWSIRGDAHGSTIDQNGVVTFGDPAHITIMAECGSDNGDIMDLIIGRVRIMFQYQDAIPGILTDVTDETVNVEVGNLIEVEAEIQPIQFRNQGTNYAWGVTEEILKNYDTKAESDPIKPVLPADYQKEWMEFHWINGGFKTCLVTVRFNGILLSAQTNFDVYRPAGRIIGTIVHGPWVEDPDPTDLARFWVGAANVKFERQGAFPTGDTCWTQMLDFYQLTVNTVPPTRDPGDGLTSGLDNQFVYGPKGTTQLQTGDTPGVQPLLKGRDFSEIGVGIQATMYLMYRSYVRKSRWVVLRGINWSASVKAAYNPASKKFQVVMPPGVPWMADSDFDEIMPPNWKRKIFTVGSHQ
ncbi:MAG: hypothetical protein RL088_3963 [Verrucomicrobiota bacterium]|jgi:hypothetical protein